MIHYLYYFIPLPAESEILLTFKRRKHEELIDYGIFSQLDFAALCGDRRKQCCNCRKNYSKSGGKDACLLAENGRWYVASPYQAFLGRKLQRV